MAQFGLARPDVASGRSLVMAYHMYIIRSEKDGRYYIGQTKDPEERLTRHNLGHSKATKAKRPWEIVYTEEFATRAEAVQRENELKQKKNKKFIEELVNRGVAQFGLARLNGVQEVAGSNPVAPTKKQMI